MSKSQPIIDVICFSGLENFSSWERSTVEHCSNNILDINRALRNIKNNGKGRFILFWGLKSAPPDNSQLLEITRSSGDVWHGGLSLGMGMSPMVLNHIQPNWMLNINPNTDIVATSWRIDLRACLFSRESLEQYGEVPSDYSSLMGAALDLGYQMISSGFIIRNCPELVPNDREKSDLNLSVEDEVVFVIRNFSVFWNLWLIGRVILSGTLPRLMFVKYWRSKRKNFKYSPSQKKFLTQTHEVAEEIGSSVTVIVPTLNRYPSLSVLLDELSGLNPKPLEVVVIDQSPINARKEKAFYMRENLSVRVIFQDTPGQCSSRNEGIQSAKGEHLLFLDDDDENLPPDLLAQHLKNLRVHRADVSSGIAPEPGVLMPDNFMHKRHSDVFPTNNSLIRKSILEKTGLFDLAYNRGSRADHDLGMRLYLSGATMVLNPEISVLHNHVQQGGLREHKARVVTYAKSRSNIFVRHFPNKTELYLMLRYFEKKQIREALYIMAFGTLSMRGSGFQRFAKLVVGLLLMPHTWFVIQSRLKEAQKMMGDYPKIPFLKS